MNIAVVGSGISGLGAAYFLSARHRVEVFEAEDRIGGHTATVDVSGRAGQYAVDTGFIVFNDRTYPNFLRLLNELGVAYRPTRMSFSVSDAGGTFEYAGSNLNTLFCQRSNLLRARYWTMLRDILRFNREAVADLDAGRISSDTTLAEYLERGRYSDWFRDRYLIPMGAAIWSSGCTDMAQFPLQFFVRFFRNHGLLQVRDRPQWYTVNGGSRQYLEPLTRRFADRIHRANPVRSLRRQPDGVYLRLASGELQRFDHVVLATHSDQALALLDDASDEEQGLLGAIPYRSNEVVLHTDESLLPKRRLAWSSWNYRMKADKHELPTLTYNMNILQGLNAEETFCVTLNDSEAIDPQQVQARFRYSHPVFSLDAIAAQTGLAEINGQRATWFCGAWCGNGFHEDGLSSALNVARALGVDW